MLLALRLLNMFQIVVQSIETGFPKPAIFFHSVRHLFEALRFDPAWKRLRFSTPRNQARALQHLKMLGDCRQAHGVSCRYLTNGLIKDRMGVKRELPPKAFNTINAECASSRRIQRSATRRCISELDADKSEKIALQSPLHSFCRVHLTSHLVFITRYRCVFVPNGKLRLQLMSSGRGKRRPASFTVPIIA
jgi:hypothetical protein